MRTIPVLAASIILGLALVVGVIWPAMIYSEYGDVHPDGGPCGTVSWHVPMFDGHGIKGFAYAYTDIDIPEEEYLAAVNDMDMPRRILAHGFKDVPDCPEQVLDAIERTVNRCGGDMNRYDEWQICMTISAFVVNGIGYEYDDVLYGVPDYAATPTETLYLGKGDCEDVSILFVSIARAYSIKSVLIQYKDHVSAGVDIGGYGRYKIDGYAVIECTHSNMAVSYLPSFDLGEGVVMGTGWVDGLYDSWSRYCNRSAAFNPILFIGRTLS